MTLPRSAPRKRVDTRAWKWLVVSANDIGRAWVFQERKCAESWSCRNECAIPVLITEIVPKKRARKASK